MSDKKLKPCPFCGSKPKFFKPKDFEEQEQIYCCPNGCTAGLTKDEWNTRPESPLVEMDEKAVYDLIVEIAENEVGAMSPLGAEITKKQAKAIVANFGSPPSKSNPPSPDLKKMLEEFDKEFPETIGNTNGIKGYPFIGRIDFKSFIMSHWPKPDPRFVEVGKKEACHE